MKKIRNGVLRCFPEKIKENIMIKGLRNEYSRRYYFVDKHSNLNEIVCRKNMKSVDVVSKYDEKFN